MDSQYYSGEGIENFRNWSWDFADLAVSATGLTPKGVTGVISSLSKKGLVDVWAKSGKDVNRQAPVRHFGIQPELNILTQGRMIVLQRQDVSRTGIDDCLRNGFLTAHRIGGDHRTPKIKQRQHVGNGGDLIGFFSDRLLGQHPTGLSRKGAH